MRRGSDAAESRWACVDGRWVEDGPWWGLERSVVEVQRWRVELEVRLAGAILRLPRVGLLRADEAGVTAASFERPDALLMYQAAQCCRADGTVEDKSIVLATARAALRSWDLWDPRQPRAARGLAWSDESLVALACGADGDAVGDVTVYGPQLVEVERRMTEGRRLWGEMYRLFEAV